MGATLRILPKGSFNLSPDGLDDFPAENGAVSQTASDPKPDAFDDMGTVPVLMQAVPAYPPTDIDPSSSAFLAPPTDQAGPDSPARSQIISSVARALRAVLLAPIWAVRFVVTLAISGIWGLITGTCSLLMAAVRAVGRGILAVVTGTWNAICAAGAAVARFARAGVQAVVNTIAAIANAIAAMVRAVALGIWRVMTGTVRPVAAGVDAVRRGVTASALFVWHRIVACGTAIAGFARAVAPRIAHAIARTTGFAGAVLAATGHGMRAVVVSTATRLVITTAAAAGAAAAIVWAIVLGLWSVARGTARLLVAGGAGAMRHGVPIAISFVRQAITACAAGVVFLVRAAGRDGRASFARTSALIQHGSDTTAARGVTGLQAIGRTLSTRFAGVAGATARGVAAVTALTGPPLEHAAHRATVCGGVAATRASAVSMRAWQHLTALADAATARLRVTMANTGTVAKRGSTSLIRRLYEGAAPVVSRILQEVAGAKVALAGMPRRGRYGLWVPTMAVVLVATLAASSGVLLMSRNPAAPAAPTSAPAVASIRPAAPAVISPANTQRFAPNAGGNQPSVRLVTAPAVRTESVRPPTPTALPSSERTGRTVNATQVKALWGKTDTRSLDRALASIRSATLAFQRCNLQMTSADVAVAHCDEARVSDGQSSSQRRPVAWTIDFRRADSRWLIEQISTSTTASNR